MTTRRELTDFVDWLDSYAGSWIRHAAEDADPTQDCTTGPEASALIAMLVRDFLKAAEQYGSASAPDASKGGPRELVTWWRASDLSAAYDPVNPALRALINDGVLPPSPAAPPKGRPRSQASGPLDA